MRPVDALAASYSLEINTERFFILKMILKNWINYLMNFGSIKDAKLGLPKEFGDASKVPRFAASKVIKNNKSTIFLVY